MKKILFILSFLITVNLSFAQVKVGSDGDIISTGSYPVVKSGAVKGGLHLFHTIIERNAFPANFRDTGMLAYVIDSAKFFYLNNSIDNSAWTVWSGSGGSSCPLTFSASSDSLYFYIVDCHNDSTILDYYGDGKGGSGSSTDNWDSVLTRQTTPISADRTVDFGDNNLSFNNLGTLFMGGDNILINSPSNTKSDTSSYINMNASDFVWGRNNDANVKTSLVFIDSTIFLSSANSLDSLQHLIVIKPNGITIGSLSSVIGAKTFLQINNLDSSNANPNNIAWFDSQNILHRGAIFKANTATLSSGTVTVATTLIHTGDLIYISYNTPSGTQGFLSAPEASIVDRTSFVINSSSGSDNSTVNWQIISN